MDPPASHGTQEPSEACGGALLMWQRTIYSAPISADFSLFLAIFQPLWYHTEAPAEPKLLVKVTFNF